MQVVVKLIIFLATDYSSTTTFDNNVAQLHDCLTLVEQKIKGLIVVVGDTDDMDSALQKQMVSY